MNPLRRLFLQPFFIRLFHWEFWSFNAIYTWIMPLWVLLGIRARSFFFFSASNPSIRNGGFLNESKKDLHDIIPAKYYPKTLHFSLPANAAFVIDQLRENGFLFPLIGKPDFGGRGRGIKILGDETDVRDFVKSCYIDFHIQEYVSFPNEVGIFYYRYPNQDKGRISGIVRKEFLSVKGDGKSTLNQLIRSNWRTVMYLSEIKIRHNDHLETILPPGEKWVLSPYGNHARGSTFIDDTEKADLDLNEFIDGLSKEIPGFYFGRFDIRFRDWEELKKGRDFTIIELNGAGAEPTHMYDPRHSLFYAWKEIMKHWIILWRISRINHRRGHRYLTVKEGLNMFRESDLNDRKLAAMSV